MYTECSENRARLGTTPSGTSCVSCSSLKVDFSKFFSVNEESVLTVEESTPFEQECLMSVSIGYVISVEAISGIRFKWAAMPEGLPE